MSEVYWVWRPAAPFGRVGHVPLVRLALNIGRPRGKLWRGALRGARDQSPGSIRIYSKLPSIEVSPAGILPGPATSQRMK